LENEFGLKIFGYKHPPESPFKGGLVIVVLTELVLEKGKVPLIITYPVSPRGENQRGVSGYHYIENNSVLQLLLPLR